MVCLGEALVDLVCERPVARLADAPSFVPRPGGSLANIATVAARFGARVEMLGGAGDDEWGRWLRESLERAGVGVGRLRLVPGPTAHAFVSVSAAREPSFAFYGGELRPAAAAADDLEPALDGKHGVLVVGSDTLVRADEREVTARAAALARARGWTVLCDPNLRPRRWTADSEMLDAVRALVASASVVKCNGSEAVRLAGTGEGEQPERAARGLLALGPRAAAITLGGDGALFVPAGAASIRVDAPGVRLVDATGAGDSVAGVLAAALSQGASPEDLDAALPLAMRTAAGVVAHWGALDGLPEAATARAALAEALGDEVG